MKAHHALLAMALGLACAATTTVSPAPPVAEPAAAVEPEPTPEPPPRVAEVEPTPDPPPSEPAPEPFDPLKLSDEQLQRARRIQKYVTVAAAEYGLDPNLLNGVIWVESKFNPKARNRSGAKGLMQLMPKTGQAMARAIKRRHRPYDPEFSVHAGAKLLSILLNKFDGDEQLALFGYARGGGRVRAYLRDDGEIPAGVVKFIAKVDRARKTFDALGFPAPDSTLASTP